MIVEEPVGALSNLLAVMKRDVMAQPGVDAAQRFICAIMTHAALGNRILTQMCCRRRQPSF